ncbi:CBS (cystathionine-beta-synthase) domain-containing protein [Tieghemostelium lacteum]|uniref:CBS (Cystathionine-beta-synthase) domain-containing protein n=1 Tax=Tieghemostelium lacteum TaxID=361077 RepID=A0A151ZJS4_TIELA|nr:CBS (cystathionine-beta-synthase) domain-containing protein [Tieghemostelium lacteum]|eukprot:KYQ94064.1 CBS (cystathionine-beta-synthase) domain-containing protein [Tieghemostelium lacteum]
MNTTNTKDLNEFILQLTNTSLGQFKHDNLLKKRKVNKNSDVHSGESFKKEIICAHRDDSIESIYNKLINNQILSCPVLRQNDVFYGMIDLFDIIKFIVDEVGKNKFKNLNSLFDSEIFKNKTVGQLMEYPYGKSIKFAKLHPSSSVFSAFETLSQQGINRIVVVDEQSEVTDIITQYDIVRYIYDNKHLLGENKRQQKLSEFLSSNQYVMSITENEDLIDAFRLIKIVGVGGVAIIEPDGTLVGNISASDIKVLGKHAESWKKLFEPVKQFVDGDPITCSEDNTLEDILSIFHTKNIHRVYIVDISFKTLGVISLRDLIKELLPLHSSTIIPESFYENLAKSSTKLDYQESFDKTEIQTEKSIEGDLRHKKPHHHHTTTSTSGSATK